MHDVAKEISESNLEDIEEKIEEKPSYLKKRQRTSEDIEEEDEDWTPDSHMDRVTKNISTSNNHESSSKTENLVKKGKWYKHPLFIISVGYMVLSYAYQAVEGNKAGHFQLGLIELLSVPIISIIIYLIYKLIRIIIKSIK